MHSRNFAGMMGRMSAIAGRSRRQHTGPQELLQGRVAPDVKELARNGAAARGVSLAAYLEILVRADELAARYTPLEPSEQLPLGLTA
jgi:hypothetical protein